MFHQYFLLDKNNSDFVFRLIDIEQTDSLISNPKNKSSFGYGLISKLVKLLKSVIVRYLTLIINQMLSTRIFMEAMKMSKVIPLLEK